VGVCRHDWPPQESLSRGKHRQMQAPRRMLQAGILAAHKGVPPVLRDMAPGLPKQGPPWDIEGELRGLKDFALKRPFEANKCDATGHFGHHKNKPGHIKTSSVLATPHTLKHHVPWGCTCHHNPPSKSLVIFILRPIERVRDWKRRGWQHGYTPTLTCHTRITCATHATQRLTRQPHPKPCTSNKRRFPLTAWKRHFVPVPQLCTK
jgi:hypothetical protein